MSSAARSLLRPLRDLAAEQGGVDRDAAAPGRGHLRPAGAVRVARLDAEQVRERGEQVVPGVQAAPRRGRVDQAHRLADERHAHRDARELGHVAGARDVAGRVEAVRVGEVRVGEPELRGRGRSSARRSARPSRGRRTRRSRSPRRSRSARARHGSGRAASRAPRAEVDRRLADRGGWREIVATSSSEACSSATSAVISFVIDAIGSRSRSSCAARTSPVPAFWTRYASASTGGGAAAATTARESVASESQEEGNAASRGGHST